jgi:hypothetical protein
MTGSNRAKNLRHEGDEGKEEASVIRRTTQEGKTSASLAPPHATADRPATAAATIVSLGLLGF